MKLALYTLIILIILVLLTSCQNGVGYNASMDWIDRQINDTADCIREARMKRLMRQQAKIEREWEEYILQLR